MKCDMAGAATTLGIVFAAARLKLPDRGSCGRGLHGEHDRREGLPSRRRLQVAGGQDRRGHQHRRRGPAGACRRAHLGGAQAQARLHDRPRDAHRAHAWSRSARGALRSTPTTTSSHRSTSRPRRGRAKSFWRMPLDRDLRSTLKSAIADLKHIGGRYGGSITAALFLKGVRRRDHLDASRHRRTRFTRPCPRAIAERRDGFRGRDRGEVPGRALEPVGERHLE